MSLFSRGTPHEVVEARRRAFEIEALPHFREIHASAYRAVRRQANADDLAQEVFLQAWKSWHRFRPGTNCRAWLYKILWNVHHQNLRKKAPSLLGDDADRVLGNLEAQATRAAGIADEEVASALDQLPEIHREIVLLSYVEGFTYQEIASILEIPIGTVMSRLFRARATLRGLLAGVSGNAKSAVGSDGGVVQP